MNRDFFFAQDQPGNMQKVHIARHVPQGSSDERPQASPASAATYSLDDGSPVKRIDSDTFMVLGTGAYVTLIRE